MLVLLLILIVDTRQYNDDQLMSKHVVRHLLKHQSIDLNQLNRLMNIDHFVQDDL
jgi:hypothetical protein